MKAFKKIFLFLLVLTLTFPLAAYAKENISKPEENISNQENNFISSINGSDVIIRNCKKLNIREKPSTSSNVIATIDCGEHLTVLDQSGKWFEVKYGDISGFVFWKYIYFTEEEISEDSNLIGNSIIHYTSSENRDTNISLACATINETILNPGDEFRWSNIVGQTTSKKGYLKAPVIINKKSVPGLGGGVCQVSTTLYNALLDTSMKPTEHHYHSIGSAYSKNDATVAHGSKDFAFNNTYDFPIKIEAYSYKATVFVNIYRVEDE